MDGDLATLRYASRNAAVLTPAATVRPVCADVRTLTFAANTAASRGEPAGIQAIFIDPARRTDGRRLRAGDSEPALDFCFGLAGPVPAVCIKSAPGIPHQLVPAAWEIEFVAVGRNLKEALLWSPAMATARRRASVLPAGDTLVDSPGEAVPVAPPGKYLLDPNPAVTRAVLVQELARDLAAWQVDPMIAFLSLDRPVSTPFARTLRVLESMPWHERLAAQKLRELGIGAADIRRRGLAGDVAQIRRRLALQGGRNATIVLTRRDGQPWGLICEPVPR